MRQKRELKMYRFSFQDPQFIAGEDGESDRITWRKPMMNHFEAEDDDHAIEYLQDWANSTYVVLRPNGIDEYWYTRIVFLEAVPRSLVLPRLPEGKKS
jgi:hypothetical protein